MNKHVIKYYFTHVEGENWKCRCGRNRKQKLKKGFSNLISHIQVDHPNWQTEVPLGTGQQTIPSNNSNISKKGQNIYNWLEWIIMGHHPFSFCENEYTRKFATGLQPISVDTLINYVDKTVEEVEKAIASALPEKFFLVGDGWTSDSVHYFAIFACYFDEATQKRKTPLLAVSPLQDEESLTAATHYEFIIGTLGLYGKSLSCVLGLVADNENLNKALARVLKVPMVGCASHRLNLAVNMFMNNYEDLLDKIHATMLKMSSLKKSGALRSNAR